MNRNIKSAALVSTLLMGASVFTDQNAITYVHGQEPVTLNESTDAMKAAIGMRQRT